MRITRSKDRVRIETISSASKTDYLFASPGRKTGCGLKLFQGVSADARYRASPGRKTGCGLKPVAPTWLLLVLAGITRSKDRVRIETGRPSRHRLPTAASPGRKTGCGLKHAGAVREQPRQLASPGRKTGCGLKQVRAQCPHQRQQASPGRKTGCGLKRAKTPHRVSLRRHHPVERPGAD